MNSPTNIRIVDSETITKAHIALDHFISNDKAFSTLNYPEIIGLLEILKNELCHEVYAENREERE